MYFSLMLIVHQSGYCTLIAEYLVGSYQDYIFLLCFLSHRQMTWRKAASLLMAWLLVGNMLLVELIKNITWIDQSLITN